MKHLADYKVYTRIYVDAMNLLSRNYHAMNQLEYKGKPTGMLYGVARDVLGWKLRYRKARIYFLWEGRESWRKKKYPFYKAHRNRDYRDKTKFYNSLKEVAEILPAMGVWQATHYKSEADDLVCHYAYYGETGHTNLFVTTDWDWWVLVDHGDILDRNHILTREDMRKRFAKKFNTDPIEPTDMWRFKILCGDPSDNISGIPRFPRKLAVDLVTKAEDRDLSYSETLEKWGETKWAEKVEEYDWLLQRNLELISMSPIVSHEIEFVKPKVDNKKFKETLLKSGIETLAEKVKA